MKQLMPFIIIIVFFILIAIFILALYNHRLKKRIIDAGPLDETGLKFLAQLSGSGNEAVKWGLLLLSAGIGFVVMEFVPYSAEDSPVPYGVEMIFVAIGFLLYYLFLRRQKNSNTL
jgi:peptidoglycan/LPS O-acetylase OafA/YrhL